MAADASLYPFYRSNIHERRLAAVLVRAVPTIFMSTFVFLVVLGVTRHTVLLLFLCAVTNVSMWLWMTSMAVIGILGALASKGEMDEATRRSTKAAAIENHSTAAAQDCSVAQQVAREQTESGEPRPPADEDRAVAAVDPEAQQPEAWPAASRWCQGNVSHIIVFPNYKEDEDMMAETLDSLSQCHGAADFRVVLAMEAREGERGRLKGERLQKQFESRFTQIFITSHPSGLVERHVDGSQDAEVPGKASNLKWAVSETHKEMNRSGSLNLEEFVVTVADADCLFHPNYFEYISRDFATLRKQTGAQQLWSMWQAPQLPFRNFYESPVVSRTWGYVASFYEFGGVSSLLCGGHHMVFSGYSLSLALAVGADAWDGDVLAEDHHAYLKCLFYSAWAAGRPGSAGNPIVQVRPVMLPVKATSVVSDQGYWMTWLERWRQAKRHAQGVAEFSYALLAMWDGLRHLPCSSYNYALIHRLGTMLTRLFCVHLLPLAQFVAMTVFTFYWLYNQRKVPLCPDRIWVAPLEKYQLLCGFAGAWALTWPVVVPLMLIITANIMFLWVAFVRPAAASSRWHIEDAGVTATCGSKLLTVILLTCFDCTVCLGPLMLPYGLAVQVIAFGNLVLSGNRVEYIPAAKAASLNGSPAISYGSTATGDQKAANLMVVH